ncbi:MAG: iron-containing alcohol dehydrogenase [Eggerthellaceae bacterium]|jgi:alcohol dehydrogenase YqhD (iron-dependent ADH family)
MNAFDYSYPVRIHFGAGCVEEALAGELAGIKGETVMIAYGGGSVKRTGLFDRIAKLLKDAGKTLVEFGGIMPNPTYKKVQEGAQIARRQHVDYILAVGGGSVADCCKIVSAQALLDEDIWEYEYQKGKQPTEFLPFGAIVTVSGTGAENNNGAVITNQELQQKAPLTGAFAQFAILDPEVTLTVPLPQVVSGAFDTLSHCMETYMGAPRTPNVSDEMNEAVQRNVIRNMRALLDDPNDIEARSELMWDSAMAENGILKIGKQTDFQAHMIEHQLGAYTDCNHGRGLAVIHPSLYRHLANDATAQLARLAREVWGVKEDDDHAAALAGIDALEAFITEMGLPTRFSQMGITDADDIFQKVADTCILTPGCARTLPRQEVFDLLHEVA